MVDVKFERKLARTITLVELKTYAESKLAGFALLRRGNRLSVMPVDAAHWRFVLSLDAG
jgi:predicted RNA-binding protein with PUA-like domain